MMDPGMVLEHAAGLGKGRCSSCMLLVDLKRGPQPPAAAGQESAHEPCGSAEQDGGARGLILVLTWSLCVHGLHCSQADGPV